MNIPNTKPIFEAAVDDGGVHIITVPANAPLGMHAFAIALLVQNLAVAFAKDAGMQKEVVESNIMLLVTNILLNSDEQAKGPTIQ